MKSRSSATDRADDVVADDVHPLVTARLLTRIQLMTMMMMMRQSNDHSSWWWGRCAVQMLEVADVGDRWLRRVAAGNVVCGRGCGGRRWKKGVQTAAHVIRAAALSCSLRATLPSVISTAVLSSVLRPVAAAAATAAATITAQLRHDCSLARSPARVHCVRARLDPHTHNTDNLQRTSSKPNSKWLPLFSQRASQHWEINSLWRRLARRT